MPIPHLRHWFSNHAISIIIPTVISASIGLWSLLTTMSDSQFWVMFSVLTTSVAVVWWRAAAQDRDSYHANEMEAKQAKTIDDLLARLEILQPSAPLPSSVIDLRSLPAHEIRSRVAQVAKKMRSMEHSFKQINDIFAPISDSREAHVRKLTAQSNERSHRWQNDLRPEAVALWHEMQRRIYGAPPYPDERGAKVALELGMLAGPSPLNDAAILLERLARDIPG